MDEKLVTIGKYRTAIEAHMARAVLEEEGVRCYVQDEELVTMLSHVGTALGGVKLCVAACDAERAAGILAELEQTHQTPSAEEDEE